MKVLRFLLPAILAASLSLLVSGSASATDHPWDDSSVDTSQTTGYDNSNVHRPIGDETRDPIIVEIHNFFLRFLKSVFALDVKTGDDEREVGEVMKVRVKGNRTFVNVRSKLL